MPSRRIKIMSIDRECFAGLFRQQDRQLIFEGLPDDAMVVGISEHVFFDRDLIAIKFESATFPEVEEGHAAPELQITVREVDLLSPTFLSAP